MSMGHRQEHGTPPPVRVGRLESARDVRKELARLYRRALRGEVAPSDASKLGSVLNHILTSVRVDELEARIVALEKAAEGKGP